MPETARAIGYLELNSKQFDDAIVLAKNALLSLGAAFAALKTTDFFKEGIEGAIKFGNEAYLAAQKLNGYDPGKLLIVQKAIENSGLAAGEARQKIEEFGLAGRPLEQLFKGGSAGFGEALTRSAKEYGTQAAVLSQSAEKFAYVQMQLDNVGTKLQGFFIGLADKIANPLSGLLDQIDKIDLVGMGERFGKYVVDAINVLRGLIANKDLFEALSLSLKVGFEIAVDFLLQPALWSGIAKVALGSLAIIGTFLTQMMLGIGSLFAASIEAAFARIEGKYSWVSDLSKKLDYTREFNNQTSLGISPEVAKKIAIAKVVNDYKGGYSTDPLVNFKAIQEGSLVKQEQLGASKVKKEALATALDGLTDLLKAKDRVNVSFADSSKLQGLILSALKAGQALNGPLSGKPNPTFSETADPIHIIADSLARVGGGGRYVRTGLSIAEKAALDSLRYQKQTAENTKIFHDLVNKIKYQNTRAFDIMRTG